MSYYFYLGETLLPVAPTAIDTTINGKNTTRFFGNSFSYKPAATFLDAIKDAKENVNPMRFIVTRMNFDGSMLWNTNMLTTIEDYTISENANNATDIEVAIKLREYVPFGTQEVEVVKDKDGKETLKVKERRYTPDEKFPAAVKITNQLSVLETVKGVGNGTLDWRAAAKRSGLENPLAKNLRGKVVKLG